MGTSPARLPAPNLPAGPRSALVIATTTYDDPLLRQLRAPAADAAEFAAVLADPAIGAFEVASVVDRPVHEVRIAIEEFLEGRTPEDLVVVYLSCHGVTDARRRLHFAATDTFKSRLASTGVDSVWVHDRMEECRARRQVLILDCCFSGAFARGAKGAEALGLDHMTESGRGRAVLTASNATEYSFETPTSVHPWQDSPAPGSIFTAALLAGLRDGSADVDGNGFVTVDEAYAYAYKQVRASGAAQTPQRWLSGGEGELLLARSPAGRPVIPVALPESLRAALDSPLPGVRIGAVEELRDWLTSSDPARVVTAIRELEGVADNDMPRVAIAARSALTHLRPAGPTPAPPGLSTSQPGGSAAVYAANLEVSTIDLICDVCGASNPPDTEFCTTCGSFLGWDRSVFAKPSGQPAKSTPPASNPAANADHDHSTTATPTTQTLPLVPTKQVAALRGQQGRSGGVSRGWIGTIIGMLVITILVIVILQLT
jgi:hypothetical protein